MTSMVAFVDHINSDCQELDFQQLELLKALKKFSSLFTSLSGLAKQEVVRQISESLHLKLTELSESEWAHPIVCVSKRNGSIRLCVDYRHLNSYTVADAYPMQNAKDLLFEVGQANYIIVLELTKGYWQVSMAEEAKPYTAFVTQSGHYQFRVMLLGMKNTGSFFQKVMDKMLMKHCAYCRSYIDDVAIFSKSWEQHIKPLCEVFQTIQQVRFRINLKKCNFARKRVKFLGHMVGSGQHSPNPAKKLAETETWWATIEHEAYAVIEALKRFDNWIFGAEVEVISDHNPLTYLILTTPQSAELTRWALALQRYNISISYKKGVKHGNADALSRLPIPVN
ncbi:retrovirus-related Pol polyprotein from transposon 17.6 [Trichonephila clavipes]|nr:retrovirus-related Pol polyprotein from transposon 17.6 [Trichonephila clavipes]